ncbi:unnamed protein product [Chrysodeixis includens]|uniref:Uncharacterized protein n=1 Tax=Chrysodeixis includens TaxID=689277 RepID=A0A9N8Q0X1_CHRIL|nr:unnamed protein product [Chrysodeixis includens]
MPMRKTTTTQLPKVYPTHRHPPKSKRKCCPYDFNSKICKIIDDRMLCGFNKNVGQPKSNKTAEHMHGDCRLRGGRIECGYVEWPYRRDPPLATDHQYEPRTEPNNVIETNPPLEPEIYTFPKEPEMPMTPAYPEVVTQCVEVDNRIILMTAFAVETAGCNTDYYDNNIQESPLDSEPQLRRLPPIRTTTSPKRTRLYDHLLDSETVPQPKQTPPPKQEIVTEEAPELTPPSKRGLVTQQRPRQLPQSRRSCCPYDFDSRICKVIDDRLLCGFNKNVGIPKSKNSAESLHGGCRLRGGRLECGYEQGPFTNPRRPPVWEQGS